MNLETLAKLAEVSVGTVSKAFSGSKEISEDTKDRIFALAKEHGCFDKYNKNRFEKRWWPCFVPKSKANTIRPSQRFWSGRSRRTAALCYFRRPSFRKNAK